jgi:hypothetical protein
MKRTGIISAVVTAMLIVSMCGNAYAAPKKSKKSKEPASKTKSESTKEPARTTPKSESKPASSSNSSEPVPANATSKSEAKKEAQKPAPAPKDLGPNSEDDFDFEVNDDITKVTITGYHGTRTDVVLPTSIQGVPIVSISGRQEIGYRAERIDYFVFTTGITSLVVPDNIQIGYNLFKDKGSLLSLTVGNGVQIWSAFEECPNLRSVSIGKDCTIDNSAFANCGHLESITIGENTRIYDGRYHRGGGEQGNYTIGAFVGCTNLLSVNLGKNVRIGDLAFAFCSSLKSVVIPKGCNRLGIGVFAGCSSLESVSFPEGLTIIDEQCFIDCTKLSQVHLPSTIKYIGIQAFCYCPIASIDFLPEGLLYLGWRVFTLKHDDTVASSIVLPKSLKWFESSYKAYRYKDTYGDYYRHEEGDFDIFGGDLCDSLTVPDGCTPKMLLTDSGEFPEITGRDIISFAKETKNLKFQKQLANFKIATCCASMRVAKQDVKKYKSNPNYFTSKDYYGDETYRVFTEDGKAFYADLLTCGFSEDMAKLLCSNIYSH